jgi:pimeloyl-ACP methyl ester carboxylesterase
VRTEHSTEATIIGFVNIGPGPVEYQLIPSVSGAAPTIVLLHEGLGSISMWRDFPSQLAQETQCDVLLYSRHGYGNSHRLQAPRTARYMHDEALTVLPLLLDHLRIENPILFGHSDGGSIALIHAGGSGRTVAGVIALAPHVFVEDISVTSIAAARTAFATTNLRERLARHHADVDGAFRGWNDIWLDPEFRDWNIQSLLPDVRCPILIIQGEDDEYGTIEQMRKIARGAPEVELRHLAACGHSPHRDQPEQVLHAVGDWLARNDLRVAQRSTGRQPR